MAKELIEYCNNCFRKNEHQLIFQKSTNGSEPYGEGYVISWCDTYILMECCGCHEVLLKHIHDFSEVDNSDIYFYPPRLKRKKPEWVIHLPSEQRELIDEVYNAIAFSGNRLAVMGTRSLIDYFINDKIGDVGTFTKKLDTLIDKGFISLKQKDILSIALDLGHAVTHRGFYPNTETLNQVLDIVENLLQNYSLDGTSKLLKEDIPKRKKL